MKPIVYIATVALAAGCARPAYVAKSDAAMAWMQGSPARVAETSFNDPAGRRHLPADTLDLFDIHTELDYNHAGNITRMASFRGPDSLRVSEENYFYDLSGERLERAETYDPASRGTIAVLYEYDSAGRLTREVESNGFYHFGHTYNRHGYPKTQTTDSPETENETGKEVVIARYRYDKQGRLKKLTGERRERYRYHPDGTLAEVRGGRNSIDSYNEHGDLTSMAVRINRRNRKGRVFERFEVTLTAEYEYDAHGNWTRRTQLYKGDVVGVAVRRIKYHDEAAPKDEITRKEDTDR
ncbi:MAG: hypothetical protein LBV38_05045 [Alistipes sp.]|jgi:hypothetical protein|nr:hypothetical protein [Alistipes sp.]